MRITPTGAVFLSATGLTGIAAAVWYPSLAGAVFCVLAAMVVLSIVPLRAMSTEHRPPDTCFAGIRSNGTVTITNSSRLFPVTVRAVTLHYREPGLSRPMHARAEGPWTLGPRQSRKISYPLRCLRRGLLKFERIELELTGVPPLVMRRVAAPDRAEIAVFPRPALVRRPVPVRAQGLERPLPTAQQTRRGSEDEFSGIREYQPGDSIRYIHWRTSFKIPGRLRVMEFAGAEAGHARIILDTHRDRRLERPWRLDFERAIAAAGALWDYLDRQGIFVTLQLPDRNYSGRHMIRPMLEALSRLGPTGESPAEPPVEPGTAVFWISPNETLPRIEEEALFVLNPERTEEYFQVL
jgi:uncharacterized protein (DUF58 family)